MVKNEVNNVSYFIVSVSMYVHMMCIFVCFPWDIYIKAKGQLRRSVILFTFTRVLAFGSVTRPVRQGFYS